MAETTPDIAALLSEYVAVIRARVHADQPVTVKDGRVWAVILVDDYPHSVVDRATGEVHMTGASGTPWNRSTFGDSKGREAMYDLTDPSDRAVLFGRVSAGPLGKRPYPERQARFAARKASS